MGRAVGPRHRFFGGKGGVGKTTCAAAAAIATAERGGRVLVVSTDPAHSLGDALAHRLSARPRRVVTRRGELYAVELDADRALERWLRPRRDRLRTIVARGTYLDDDDIDRFLRLSLPGVDELIGLVELGRLARERPYDDVVVDTAPTGHTLRLLGMPATLQRIATVLDDMQAKHRYLTESLAGRYRADAADGFIAELAAESQTLQALLRDADRCAFAWVLLPEPLSLDEARDALAALASWGIAVGEIIVNRVVNAQLGCALCTARSRGQASVIASIRAAYPDTRIRLMPERDAEPRGIGALRALGPQLTGRSAARPASLRRSASRDVSSPRPLSPEAQSRRRDGAWLEQLIPPGLRLLLVAGKGGVGKTSCAAALALALAHRAGSGDVLLLSTDPAPALGDVLATAVGDTARPVPGVARLHARELDADQVFTVKRERYRKAVDEVFAALRGGSRFDVAFDRTVVQDLIDLAPPGLDELLGILAVVEALGDYATIVLDTPPTGHALRLLQMPAAALEWVHALLAILLKYRAVTGLGDLGVDLLAIARDIRRLQALLADRAAARVIVVTRAAELPRRETARLLGGLRRLGLPATAVVVNALIPPGCHRCRRAAAAQSRALGALRRECRSRGARRCAIINAPAVAPPPSGHVALTRWRAQWELDGKAE